MVRRCSRTSWLRGEARTHDRLTQRWLDRIARGRVLDAQGTPITTHLAYREGLKIYYFREVPNEAPIPVSETINHSLRR